MNEAAGSPEANGPADEEATRLLQRLREGDALASEQLLQLLYHELRQAAGRCLARERVDHTLQPTALVHEAWMKLGGAAGADWNDRDHFVAVAARAMRQVLVDHARSRSRQKRGSGERGVPLDNVLAAYEERSLDILEINDAVARLRDVDPELADVVELRFFGGLSVPEVGRALGLSTPTIERRWRVARSWLHEALGEDLDQRP